MAENIAIKANRAFSVLKTLTDDERSTALQKIYHGLQARKDEILKYNQIDLDNANDQNLSGSLIKRLDLGSKGKFDSMLQGILDVANLPDPIGKCTLAKKLDEELNLYRITAPIGVLLIIFESRPEVIANITALAVKSGNSAILKGGKESFQTFKIMSEVINNVLEQETKVPKDAITLIESREEVGNLLAQDKYIDLVIPRGSNQLVRNIKDNTKIPVLGHADGICSLYMDDTADLDKGIKVLIDSKANYPAGCNAVEQLLVHKSIASDTQKLTQIGQKLIEAGVTLHVTPEIKANLANVLNQEFVKDANDNSFDMEYLSLDISVKQVESIDEAISHINEHSSKHTDCIVTETKENANKFLKGIDSAGVYWNCSTRFADGFRYGFGTEVGISTNKIHARGPVGLEGLMSYQYQLRGNGQIAAEYKGAGGDKVFVHEDLSTNVDF